MLALAEQTAHRLTPCYLQLLCPLIQINHCSVSLGGFNTNGNLCFLRQWEKVFLEVCQSSRCSFASYICSPLIPAHVICGSGACGSFERKIGKRQDRSPE